MQVVVDGIKICYQRNLGEGMPILLLHGWGANSQTMASIFGFFASRGRNIVSLDFPGFGDSDFPHQHYGVFEYAKLVESFLGVLGIERVSLIGHSFGGRIAILLAARTPLVERMVLVDSAGIKPKRSISYHIKVFRYKRAKKRNKSLDGFGSDDFRALPNCMRDVFTRVVNQHLEKELDKITCPTLIIWGEDDKDTPMYMAKKLKKGIKDSAIVTLNNCGHFSFLHNPQAFNLIVESFV